MAGVVGILGPGIFLLMGFGLKKRGHKFLGPGWWNNNPLIKGIGLGKRA